MEKSYFDRQRSYYLNEKERVGERKTRFFGHDVRVKPFKSLDDLERADIVELISHYDEYSEDRHHVIFDRFDGRRFVFVHPIHHNEFAFAEYKLTRENVVEESPYNSGKIELQLKFEIDRTKKYPEGVLPHMLRNPLFPAEPRIYDRYCDSEEADRVYKGRYSEMEKLVDDAIAKWGIPNAESEWLRRQDLVVKELRRKNLAALAGEK